jgi:hypothetical protein
MRLHGRELRKRCTISIAIRGAVAVSSEVRASPRKATQSRVHLARKRKVSPRTAITYRLCRLIWKMLHERVRYEERGPAVSIEAKKVRARKMMRELRGLGYRVELVAPSSTV